MGVDTRVNQGYFGNSSYDPLSFIMVYNVAERSFRKIPSFEFVESLTKSFMFKVLFNKK